VLVGELQAKVAEGQSAAGLTEELAEMRQALKTTTDQKSTAQEAKQKLQKVSIECY